MELILPNRKFIVSKEKTTPLPEPKELPLEARITNTFNQLTEGSLTLIGQYCDNGHTAIFNNKHADIMDENQLMLRDYRNPSNKIWHFDIKSKENSSKNPSCNKMNYMKPKTNS